MRRHRIVALAGLFAFCGILAGSVRAEVSILAEEATDVIILGVIEGPDPIHFQSFWKPVREDVPPALFLNPEGAMRSDRRPAIAYDAASNPRVVWSYDTGSGYDIARATWVGHAWRTELVTRSFADELDPRIAVGSGGDEWIVWWESFHQRVLLMRRRSGAGGWDRAERVSGPFSHGRRPAVVEWGGTAVVAYERTADVGGQHVVVRTRSGAGAYDEVVAAWTPRESPLDVMIHVEDDLLWIDWRSSASTYGYTVWNGEGWEAPQMFQWEESGFLGDVAARAAIRDLVLDP